MQSNYDKQVCIARELFLKYEQQDMIDKYDLEYDEDYIYLMFIGDRYRISRENGEVEVFGKAVEAYEPCKDFNVVMSLYDVLCYPKGTPALANEWCPLNGLQVTMSSPSADVFNQKYADRFAENTDVLRQVCRELDGAPLQVSAGADVCCQLDLFPFFPIQFRFWDKDDEFPANIQLLWDRNSLKFMHFETLYYVMGHLMRKMVKTFDEIIQPH